MAQVRRLAQEVRSVRRLWYSFLQFLMWSRSGDLTYLNVAGQPVVVINSRKAAVELLERRSGIYSDRPHNVVVDIMSHELFFVFAQNGDM
jgi:hypothetical protein